ncbi:MAG: hypothetical protein ORN51_14235 [Akkermansiaceae bacterium]|nr:hypothetical protein [Akkermansiaceae bacterium]
MNRRARRHGKSGGNRWLGRGFAWFVVLSLVLLGVGYGMLRSYLRSDAFRQFLSAEVSKTTGVSGEFAPFHWDGLAVDTDGFEAKGAGWITALRADDLHTEVGLSEVRRGVWQIRESNVRQLELAIDARQSMAREGKPVMPNLFGARPTKRSPWLPSEVELQGINVRKLTVRAALDAGVVTAAGVEFRVTQAGAKHAYRAQAMGGTIRLPFKMAPELSLDQVRLNYQDQQVFLTDLTMGVWGSGRIQSSGEWDMEAGKFSMQGDISGIKCENLLNENWAKRLSGDVRSNFMIDQQRGSRAGGGRASGHLVVQNGVLTALPILDAMAAYADTRRFRVLTLSDAQTEWQWQNGELNLTKLVIASEGLVRLEGWIQIRGNQLDGSFRLGLAPGTLATIPGAESEVFVPGERGLLWTSLRITGTMDDPKEDLTDRLVAAAGIRMFEQLPKGGEKVIKFAQSILGGSSPTPDEDSAKVNEKSEEVIKEVNGLLQGLLDGGLRKKQK